MSSLVVVFGKARPQTAQDNTTTNYPVMKGRSMRSCTITIGGSSVQSALSAAAGEEYVSLTAQAACWVSVGADPTAADPTSSGVSAWVPQNGRIDLAVQPGDKVAAITG